MAISNSELRTRTVFFKGRPVRCSCGGLMTRGWRLHNGQVICFVCVVRRSNRKLADIIDDCGTTGDGHAKFRQPSRYTH